MDLAVDYLRINSEFYEPELTETKEKLFNKPAAKGGIRKLPSKPSKPQITTEMLLKKFELKPKEQLGTEIDIDFSDEELDVFSGKTEVKNLNNVEKSETVIESNFTDEVSNGYTILKSGNNSTKVELACEIESDNVELNPSDIDGYNLKEIKDSDGDKEKNMADCHTTESSLNDIYEFEDDTEESEDTFEFDSDDNESLDDSVFDSDDDTEEFEGDTDNSEFDDENLDDNVFESDDDTDDSDDNFEFEDDSLDEDTDEFEDTFESDEDTFESDEDTDEFEDTFESDEDTDEFEFEDDENEDDFFFEGDDDEEVQSTSPSTETTQKTVQKASDKTGITLEKEPRQSGLTDNEENIDDDTFDDGDDIFSDDDDIIDETEFIEEDEDTFDDEDDTLADTDDSLDGTDNEKKQFNSKDTTVTEEAEHDEYDDIDLDEEDELSEILNRAGVTSVEHKKIKEETVKQQVKKTQTTEKQDNSLDDEIKKRDAELIKLRKMYELKQKEREVEELRRKLGDETEASVKKHEAVKSEKPAEKKASSLGLSIKEKTDIEVEDYSSMPIGKLYETVSKYMIQNGVSKGPIDISVLSKKFGASNINNLLKKSYLIRMGKGVTVGR